MNDSAARHTAHEALAVISRVRLLDALRACSTPRPAPGRPAHRNQLLATVLAAHWADTPAERAQRAERGLFAELGFEPELAHEGEQLPS